RKLPASPSGLSPDFENRSARYLAAFSPPGVAVPRPCISSDASALVTSFTVSVFTKRETLRSLSESAESAAAVELCRAYVGRGSSESNSSASRRIWLWRHKRWLDFIDHHLLNMSLENAKTDSLNLRLSRMASGSTPTLIDRERGQDTFRS